MHKALFKIFLVYFVDRAETLSQKTIILAIGSLLAVRFQKHNAQLHLPPIIKIPNYS